MKKKLFFRYFCAVMSIGIMIFIFIMSAQNSTVSTGTSGRVISAFANIFIKGFKNGTAEYRAAIIAGFQFLVRKSAHFSIYFLLGFFVSGFNSTFFAKKLKIFSFSAVFSLFYAISDEIHQHFVAGRSAEFRDILIDLCGIVIGAAFMIFILNIIRRRKDENRRKLKK